jgi:hypothetical protein
LDYQGQPSQLNQHTASVETYFQAHPPQTIAEAQAKIAEITGIHRSPNQVKAFLNRIGMKRRKVGFVPGESGNPEKITEQETFREDILEPLLDSAKAGSIWSQQERGLIENDVFPSPTLMQMPEVMVENALHLPVRKITLPLHSCLVNEWFPKS